MLDWIRGKRFSMRATLVVIALALAAWALVVYANLQDFVPDELRSPAEGPPP